ncbi:MAG: cytidylate kinase-like family protein, partial [Candidatus Coatesbacteria bacterium]|nr:cytidylate kinase-like family protein [Candidatus Coatesbacteria bacterium]
GRVIASKLAERLGFSLWDRELLDSILENTDIPRRVLEAFDERSISEIELFVRGVLGDYELSGFLYPKHLAQAVAEIAGIGNAIILGRGANFLIPGALHVRIDASFEHRVANMIVYEDIDQPSAEKMVRRSDKERRAFVVKNFGRNRVRDFEYDISLWMDRFTPDEAVAIIEAAYGPFFKPATCPIEPQG